MKHGFIKIAMCTPPLVPGAPDKNLVEIKRLLKLAHKQKAEVAVFGQLALTGATLGSMAKYSQLLEGAITTLSNLIAFSKTIDTAIVLGLPLKVDDSFQNVAVVVAEGVVQAIVPESSQEAQTVTLLGQEYPLNPNTIFSVSDGFDFNFSIVFGEDFDRIVPKAQAHVVGGADLVFNLASSSALIESFKQRKQKVSVASKRLNCAYAYVSTGNGEAVSQNVFSADKIAVELGCDIASSEGDKDEILFAELDVDAVRAAKLLHNRVSEKRLPTVHVAVKNQNQDFTRVPNRLPFVPVSEEFTRIYEILARGIYTRMQEAGAKKIMLGLSGGLDSTMTLLVAEHMFTKYALDKKDIVCIMMPAYTSSDRTKSNAHKMVELLGVSGMEIPIQNAVNAHMETIGHGQKNDTVYENTQARMRTHIVLDLANKLNGLMLGTGDLSEIALGWSTFGGDQLAQYNPNSSLTKTLIRAMTHNYSLTRASTALAEVLNDILATPISPELLENQDTEQLIGPYELHDFFLFNLIGKGFSVEKTFALAQLAYADYPPADILKYLRIFITRFFTNQFKRTSACDGIQLTPYDLTHKIIHSEFSAEQFIKSVEKLEAQFGKKKKPTP